MDTPSMVGRRTTEKTTGTQAEERTPSPSTEETAAQLTSLVVGGKRQSKWSEIMSSPEAASFLQIEERTLAEWRKKRGLPHIQITAKAIRYKRADLLSWMDGFRQGVAR